MPFLFSSNPDEDFIRSDLDVFVDTAAFQLGPDTPLVKVGLQTVSYSTEITSSSQALRRVNSTGPLCVLDVGLVACICHE